MDRRQKKTREAIFDAFTKLLSKKNYSEISVQEIIDTANIGRTTFYAHFETKDYLLRDLTGELFDHITDTAVGHAEGGIRCTLVGEGDSVFLHLIRHLGENERNILELLTSQNNEIFLRYFRDNLKKLIIAEYAELTAKNGDAVPKDYLVGHIASAFTHTVDWWLKNGMRESPEEITAYFLSVIEPVI